MTRATAATKQGGARRDVGEIGHSRHRARVRHLCAAIARAQRSSSQMPRLEVARGGTPDLERCAWRNAWTPPSEAFRPRANCALSLCGRAQKVFLCAPLCLSVAYSSVSSAAVASGAPQLEARVNGCRNGTAGENCPVSWCRKAVIPPGHDLRIRSWHSLTPSQDIEGPAGGSSK
jgi:hypothetical protein